jgi:hypothetical protein
MCWGNETINTANRTKDLSAAHTILVSGLKRSGSITDAFEQIRKSLITYSHCQLTYTKTRYDLTLPSECESHLTYTQGQDHEVGHREQAALCNCQGPQFILLMKTRHPGYRLLSVATVARDVKHVFVEMHQ